MNVGRIAFHESYNDVVACLLNFTPLGLLILLIVKIIEGIP